MKHCRFENLPLLQVSAEFRFSEPFELDFHSVVAFVASMREITPRVVGFNDGMSIPGFSPFPARFGHFPFGDLIRLVDDSTGLALSVRADMLAIIWRSEDAPYPGFKRLRSVASIALNALRNPGVSVVNLSYSNVDRSGIPLSEMIRIPGLEEDAHDEVIEFNVARRAPNGFEHRVLIPSGTEGERIIVTAGGVSVDEQDPIESFEYLVHDPMQIVFEQMLTEKSMDEWKYVGITE